MNHYELTQSTPSGTRALGTTRAGTLAQAARKLYRAHNIQPSSAKSLGYAVQVTTTKGASDGNS